MENFNSCTQRELEAYREILDKFEVSGNVTRIEAKVVKNGRINTTSVINMMTENGLRKLTLQRINTGVFKKPVELMENIAKATEHLHSKGKVALHVNKVKNPVKSKYLYFDKKTDSYWRLYDYIEPEDMRKLGEAIKAFCIDYNDFDATSLCETIPDFHNTSKRYSHFNAVLMNDLSALGEVRSNTCVPEYKYIIERSGKADILVKALREGKIPYRVCHNDTKINNVLFDIKTKEPLCWIDLDTVMPGTMLYDFGDAVRSGCSNLSEDATSIEGAGIVLEAFQAIAEGFIEGNDVITENEVNLMVEAAWMLTYEQGMRFLDDHIAGNHYFAVEYDGQNLERARVQLALNADIEAKYAKMQQIVKDAWQKELKRRK